MARDDISGSAATTGEIIAGYAETQPGHPAIVAPGRPDLGYAELAAFMSKIRDDLNGIGTGCGDRVALAVRPRAEMAVAHLAVSNAAIALPVDPATPPGEIDTVLSDLGASVLVVTEALPPAVHDRVVGMGIGILLLHPMLNGPAGLFRLTGGMSGPAARPGAPGAEDLAQIMRTSGTSSTPKAVPVPHQLAVIRGQVEAAAFGLTPADRCLNFRPLHLHSALNAGLMVPLSAGGTVVLPECFDPARFFDLLDESAATWFLGSPAYYAALFDEVERTGCGPGQHSLRFVRSSSYRLEPAEMARLEKLFGVPFLERLGGTEAGLVTRNPPPPGRRRPGTVGQPVDSEIALIGEDGAFLPPCQPDTVGEIVVRGRCVFQGYENDPEGSGRAFIGDWFRTGDLGRRDSDGYLTVCGRVKEVINRGGQKISPLEVESLILTHDNILEAACFRVGHATLGEDIAAAIVLRDTAKGPEDLDALNAFLGKELLAYKLPKHLVIRDTLPRGPTGKLSRASLEKAWERERPGRPNDATGAAVSSETAPPGVNAVISAIWCDILRRPRTGPAENFFALGGDSLMAARLLARVGEKTGVDLPLESIFAEGGTIAGMSGLINRIRCDGPNAQDAGTFAGPIPRRDPGQPAPLSFSQQRIRFLAEVDPNAHVYNMQGAVQLSGALDPEILRRVLNEVLARHDILRSSFPIINGELRQTIRDHLALDLPVVDLSHLPADQQDEAIQDLARAEANKPYDLATGPLIRAKLIRCGARAHVLLLPKHHIIFDGQSNGILYSEIATLYKAFSKGEPSPLAPLPVQFGDYADWQRQRLSPEVIDRQARYWLNELSGAPGLLELPADKPRPPEQSYRGGRVWFSLPKDLNNRIKAFSRDLGVTPFITMLAGFQLLLSRFSGQNDFVLGTIVGGRIRPEVEELLGLFVNTLALRVRFEGLETVAEHVARVRKGAVGAYAHQEMPFDRLVDDLNPDRNAAYAPVVQVLFGLMPRDLRLVELKGLTFERRNVDLGTARFDLSVMIGEDQNALEGFFEYSEDLFERDTIERLTGYFETVLEAMISAPERSLASISLLSEAEQAGMTRAAPDGPAGHADHEERIDTRFSQVAALAGDRCALICGDESLSYRTLEGWSNLIADRIRRSGTPPGSVVALPAGRSPVAVAIMLGVLKAGCTYLPLNMSLPKDRRDFMLSDSDTALIILPGDEEEDNARPSLPVLHITSAPPGSGHQPVPAAAQEASGVPAYIMYTSGSTGAPKGVITPHRGVLRLVTEADYIKFDEDEVFLHLASPAFDAATFEIWGALLNGARLVILPEERPALSQIAEEIRSRAVTTLWMTAGLFHQMVDQQLESFAGLRQVLAGGDVLSPDHVARFVAAHPGCRLVNGYGPTENTTFTTTYTVPPDYRGNGPVPIGVPVSGTSVYLLDDNLAPVPAGVPGEIHTGGAGVALGYINRPEMTRDRFINDPFCVGAGALMYRTGDMARMGKDGALMFLGRRDHQVKINGFRIELGETETVLRSDARVRDAVVLPVRTPAGTQALVGCVIASKGTGTEHEPALKSFLETKLPRNMVPARLIFMETFPLNQSGKVDRNALADKAGDVFKPQEAEHAAPRTALEFLLAGIWSDILGRPEISIDDNFFEIGGNSLQSMKMFFQLARETDIEFPVSLIFVHPTVRSLSRVIYDRLIEEDQLDGAVMCGRPRLLKG